MRFAYRSISTLACSAVITGLGACIAIAPTPIHRQTDSSGGSGGAGGGTLVIPDAGPPANPPPDAGSNDPHTVSGTQPSHGPFLGGGRVLVTGKGFTSAARIWFGATEVDETTTIPVDPSSVQVVAPAGTAGSVDVSVQNGDDASTRRTLVGGYTYDALYAAPDSGPVPGGTVIEIVGQGTAWGAGTIARIDNNPCTTQSVDNPTQITCTVPPGSPGSKTISVTTGAESILVLDAYTYADTDNGYKGGLSGSPLSGQLKVLVYDNFTGDPVQGALVIAGSDIATALTAMADATGVAVISDPALSAPVTVTVSGQCHSPISFVAEPVDTVTAYLDPVLTPACAAMGDPPPVGGKTINLGEVQGELVWPMINEFMKGGWSNVPGPASPNEHQAAYVFLAGSDPTAGFQLPSSASAVLPTTPGDVGYQFTVDAVPGNRSLYAVAGIENDTVSPPTFIGYAMGAVNGVPVLPSSVTAQVFINMSKTLDKELSMSLSPPLPGAKGPDRLQARVAVGLGSGGYAILPAMQKAPFLPVMGLLDFVGLPSLSGDLAGSVYVSSASAVTGATGGAPMSVISQILSTDTSQVLAVNGFVTVATLTTPVENGAWDGMHLATTFPAGGAPVDLTVYDVQAGNGLVHWTIAVPGGSQAITVPDLSGFPDLALPPGPLSIAVYGGKVTNFNYQQLLYVQMRPQGMSAYSLDYFDAHL